MVLETPTERIVVSVILVLAFIGGIVVSFYLHTTKNRARNLGMFFAALGAAGIALEIVRSLYERREMLHTIVNILVSGSIILLGLLIRKRIRIKDSSPGLSLLR